MPIFSDAPQFLLKVLQIILLNIVLSGDNVGVIALAIKRLPPDIARKANFVGVSAAVLLRIFFILVCGVLFSLQWLHIDLIGGLLLLYITWSMVKSDTDAKSTRSSNSFLKCIGIIVLADLSMSLDNILAIASVAMNGGSRLGAEEILLIVIGLLCCIPIIFFGSGLVSTLMNRYPAIVFLCAGILVHTSVKMILGDSFVAPLFSGLWNPLPDILAAACGVTAFLAGAAVKLWIPALRSADAADK